MHFRLGSGLMYYVYFSRVFNKFVTDYLSFQTLLNRIAEFLDTTIMSELLSTDVLAVLNIGDYIFVGIGYSLRTYKKSTNSLISNLDVCYPDKIHGIVKSPGCDKLAIFGGRNISVIKLNILKEAIQTTLLNDVHRFNDWIINVGWSTTEGDDSTLAILDAHNHLSLYNWRDRLATQFQCEEKCIFGSVFNDHRNNYVAFAGTVFQEIVVWVVTNVTSREEVPVLHRLRGHNGVIFSVTYDPVTSLICSTSDDRTIRLWFVEVEQSDTNSNVRWEATTISLVTTMFGHTARVWRALIRKDFVISVGEDSLVCIWTTKGALIEKIEAHHGAPIWSIDVCEDSDTIITGGGDGAVHIWPLRETANSRAENIPIETISDVPKHVGFLISGTIVIITQAGKILIHNNINQRRESIDIKMYSNYVVMQICPNRKRISLASISGHVTLFEENSATGLLERVLEDKIMDSKILSMHWLNDCSLLLCGIEGCLMRLEIIDGAAIIKSEHILPKSRERWTTTAVIHKSLLICGDRAGSIHLYRSDPTENDTDKVPFQSLLKIHGRLGVHSCKIVDHKLLSTGRDGTLRFYQLHEIEGRETITTLHLDKMPMDWVSTTLKIGTDLYVLGFKEVDFVLYSTLHQRVLLRIRCGGGHRSWDYTIKNGIFNFVYIREKQVHLVKSHLNTLVIPAIQNGFHAKEICCIQRIPTCTGLNVIISGGEDRNLRITQVITGSKSYSSEIKEFFTLALLSGHISSVKTLCLINLEDTEQRSENLIFSAGGRAQLKAWLIGMKFDQHCLDRSNLSCVELASHMLRGTDQHQRTSLKRGNQYSHYVDPETRYMNINACRIKANPNLILLLVACSDGFLRIFSYNILTRCIFLWTALPYHNRCILKTDLFNYNENIIALTMATDGVVNFWCLDGILDTIAKNHTEENKLASRAEISPFARLTLHQCGINSYDLKKLEGPEFILATGGDDNLISLMVFEIKSTKGILSIHQIKKWECSSAHSTQITGLILDERGVLISVGIDQKVLTFNYLYEHRTLKVSLQNEIITSVPDVQGMIVCHSDESEATLLCVYGKGFEFIRRKLQSNYEIKHKQ